MSDHIVSISTNILAVLKRSYRFKHIYVFYGRRAENFCGLEKANKDTSIDSTLVPKKTKKK